MKKIYEMPATEIVLSYTTRYVLAGESGEGTEYEGNENNTFDSQAKEFSESFNPDAKSLWED